mmetsp:Transcript_21115/g.66779  ORF Transcript_21115/g.66779 Transcript_21115/m.66779 type:complete len:641 (+) Transcript_21115:144-2066(+)
MWQATAQVREVELQEASEGGGQQAGRQAEAQRAGSLGSGQQVRPQAIGAVGTSCYEDLAIEEVTPRPQPSRGASSAASEAPLPRLGFGGQSSGFPELRSRRCLARAGLAARLLLRVGIVGLMLTMLFVSFARWPAWVIENSSTQSCVLSALFAAGLSAVALEDVVGINKSSMMLILAGTMWTYLGVSYHPIKSQVGARQFHHELDRGLQEVGSVILFLLPAMGVVESIDHFGGFAIVTSIIRRMMAGNVERLMPIICLLTFFLSSVIDNLTATIVALKLLRHVARNDESFRLSCGSCAVIAANAGGAWSPIGDVTTTMLWIQGKISALETVAGLFLPSLVAGVVPLAGLWWQARRHAASKAQESAACPGDVSRAEESVGSGPAKVTASNVGVLALGISCILMVPVLKIWTGLPPYLGMLLALGIVWVATDSLGIVPEGHAGAGHPAAAGAAGAGGLADLDVEAAEESSESRDGRKPAGQPCHAGALEAGVPEALHKVDLTGLLFFTGVLLAVVALDCAGVLQRYAEFLAELCGGSSLAISALLGVSSAVVDNVPLVQAAIEMFSEVERDDPLWQLVALAAGTGGSILSVGSIAGVTLMGMEGVGFLWYCRRVSLWAAVGFAAGIMAFQLQHTLRVLAQGS